MHFAERKSNLIPNFPFSLTKSSIILYFTSGRTSVSLYVSVSPESIFHPCQLCPLSWKCLSDTWVSRNWTTARVRRSIVHCSLFRGGVNRFYSDNNCPFTTVPQNNQMHQQPPWHLITPVNHIIGILLPRSQRTMLSELRFVATITTGGRVKFVPAVWIFLENNPISRIICIEPQDLHPPSVILHRNC